MSFCSRELWSYSEIARHINVQPDTVRNYRRHGLLPDPDVVDGSGHPRWYAETIRAWARNRPGHR
ncbi:helix-turn-helix transcriptional regulator [Kitasatospora sp. NPDC096147]|uniref:helix-turn-helix transcriptional regulator n=1 Tax=Kitasatospora sp. NPDC096147 TaxID=3364093 RepID=UPI0038249B4A